MTGMGAVLQRDFRDLLRTKAFRISAMALTVVTIGGAIGASIAFNRWEFLEQQPAEITKPVLELILGAIVYLLTLFVLMLFMMIYTTEPITREKANGNIESLLATPLSPRAIWMGKSLAAFLPGFILAVISSLIIVMTVNFAAIHPATGSFVFPAPMLFTGFFINPLLILGLTALIVFLCLAYNPEITALPTWGVFMGLMFGIGIGLGLGKINLASWWPFTLSYLAGAIVLGAVAFYLSRGLTKERIVLSSKG
jgi:ABC-type transport system involved in multi-copper enzyme maturation permease subunit